MFTCKKTGEDHIWNMIIKRIVWSTAEMQNLIMLCSYLTLLS